MPLMTSPIDGAPMRQVHRFGIELDICPTTGGVWLDKGELEKLIALIKEEALQGAATTAPGRYRDKDDDDDDDDRHRHRHGSSKRSRLLDIFDF